MTTQSPFTIKLDSVTLNLPLPEARIGNQAPKVSNVGGRIFQSGGRRFVCVLDRLTLHIRQGERVGLIGANGAGKSSLLRLMAGIYLPSSGRRWIAAEPSCLFTPNLGLQNEMTVRENARTALLLYGFSVKSLDARVDDIIAFADLEAFADVPLGACSSGMRTRLGFSVVTSVERSILLIDEVINTGDKGFRRKSAARLEALAAKTETLVVATHSTGQMRELCDRVVWIEQGALRADGPIDEVLAEYDAATAA